MKIVAALGIMAIVVMVIILLAGVVKQPSPTPTPTPVPTTIVPAPSPTTKPVITLTAEELVSQLQTNANKYQNGEVLVVTGVVKNTRWENGVRFWVLGNTTWEVRVEFDDDNLKDAISAKPGTQVTVQTTFNMILRTEKPIILLMHSILLSKK